MAQDDLFEPLEDLFGQSKKLLDQTSTTIDSSGHHEATITALRDSGLSSESLDKLCRIHANLVLKTAKQYQHYLNNDLSYDDLVSAGFEGLLEGLKRYDADKGFRASTYLTHWIRQRVIREVQNTGRRVRIPVHAYETILHIRRIQYRVSTYGEGDLNEDEKRFMKSENYRFYAEVVHKFWSNRMSLNTEINEGNQDNEKFELYELIDNSRSHLVGKSISNATDPTHEILTEDLRNRVFKVLNHLTKKQRQVLEKRFGLNGNHPMTLQEVGDEFGVTRERIRQIEEKAIGKLRRVRKRYFSYERDLTD